MDECVIEKENLWDCVQKKGLFEKCPIEEEFAYSCISKNATKEINLEKDYYKHLKLESQQMDEYLKTTKQEFRENCFKYSQFVGECFTGYYSQKNIKLCLNNYKNYRTCLNKIKNIDNKNFLKCWDEGVINNFEELFKKIDLCKKF
jgi:hypothetical protein